MADRPTHEELEQRVSELEEETVKLRRAEEELRAAVTRAEEDKFKAEAIIDSIGQAMSIIDTDFRFVYQNKVHRDSYGEHVGEHCYKAIKNRDEVCEGCQMAECFSDGNIHTKERVVPRGEGRLYVENTASPLRDSTGKIIAGVEIIRDITQLKRAEEALLKSEAKYRQLFATVSDAIMVFESDTKQFVDVNDAALRLYGYSKEEFLKLRHPAITAEPEKSIASIAKTLGGELTRIPLRYHKKKDGTVFPVEISASTFTLGDRRVLCGVIRDITDRKRAEEALQEREATLEARTSELEEVNSALRVLLKRMDEDKRTLEEKVSLNVKELVVPFAEKLKNSGLDAKQMTYLSILESNLNSIVSPFVYRLSSKYLGFTPTEIQVASLVRDGKSTKEIAELLNSSYRTIECHRQNIRMKIGIKKKRANLRSFLLSM